MFMHLRQASRCRMWWSYLICAVSELKNLFLHAVADTMRSLVPQHTANLLNELPCTPWTIQLPSSGGIAPSSVLLSHCDNRVQTYGAIHSELCKCVVLNDLSYFSYDCGITTGSSLITYFSISEVPEILP
ncbi:hypothetical protein KC19_9G030400 [Ceratodon purpureus]|uniref:Uncharacterized protein n=1 Tax=Ceratodon purpureus TaxID=3225 RepID=A0A8T0GN78_CERPU|nr:hypothetical protein KC19_9G030400 [Ceratodon purpureus]